MSAFARGLEMGQRAYSTVTDQALRSAKDEREAKESAARLEQTGLQTEAMRREAARGAELDRIAGELRDVQLGTPIPENLETNSGLQRQALRRFEIGQQNYEGEGAAYSAPAGLLPARQSVNINDPAYQARVAGLRQQYALANRDMKDFDAVTLAERNRITGREDADFALDVTRNPNGEAAIQARTFVNAQTKGFTIDPPNKDGISTLRIIQGDRTKPVNIDAADLGRIAIGVRRLQRGDVGGLDVIASINKDIAASIRAEMGTQLEALKANNDAAYKTAGLANDRARTAATSNYYAGRTQMDRMGGAQYFTGEDGNTYAAIPTMTRQGLKFETVQVNPEGVVMAKAGGKAPAALEKVPEDGSRVRDSRGNVFTYSEGVPIQEGGVPPSEAQKVFAAAGLPPQAEELAEWMPGRRFIRIPGFSDDLFDVKKPGDMKLAKQAIESVSGADITAREVAARGFAPRRPAEVSEGVARGRATELGALRDARVQGLQRANNLRGN